MLFQVSLDFDKYIAKYNWQYHHSQQIINQLKQTTK